MSPEVAVEEQLPSVELNDLQALVQPEARHDLPSTSEHLAHLSEAIIEAHLAPDFAAPGSAAWRMIHTYLDQDFVMANATVHECSIPAAGNLAEHLKNVLAVKRQHQFWDFQSYNSTAIVEKEDQYAVVLLTFRETGREGNAVFRRESVSMMRWKRNAKGAWMCYRHSALRGLANFS